MVLTNLIKVQKCDDGNSLLCISSFACYFKGLALKIRLNTRTPKA